MIYKDFFLKLGFDFDINLESKEFYFDKNPNLTKKYFNLIKIL
jgi:hypothetical protein